jgi:hypothetical protein
MRSKALARFLSFTFIKVHILSLASSSLPTALPYLRNTSSLRKNGHSLKMFKAENLSPSLKWYVSHYSTTFSSLFFSGFKVFMSKFMHSPECRRISCLSLNSMDIKAQQEKSLHNVSWCGWVWHRISSSCEFQVPEEPLHCACLAASASTLTIAAGANSSSHVTQTVFNRSVNKLDLHYTDYISLLFSCKFFVQPRYMSYKENKRQPGCMSSY